jgi:hypothetical protein
MADISILYIPQEYQAVEYIQSSGNGEYIDIDYVPTINTKFELDFEFVSSTYSQSDSIPVMGERSGTAASDTNKFALWVHKGNGRETLNLGSYDSGFQTATNASLRNVTSNDKANLYYNGTFISGDDSATFTSGNLPIYLFALNNNGALLSRNNVMKVYNMKLYENGVLVRDLVPCYRISDSVIGLYDTVSDSFFINGGSGSLTKGSNSSNWAHSLKKFDGTTWQNTTVHEF